MSEVLHRVVRAAARKREISRFWGRMGRSLRGWAARECRRGNDALCNERYDAYSLVVGTLEHSRDSKGQRGLKSSGVVFYLWACIRRMPWQSECSRKDGFGKCGMGKAWKNTTWWWWKFSGLRIRPFTIIIHHHHHRELWHTNIQSSTFILLYLHTRDFIMARKTRRWYQDLFEWSASLPSSAIVCSGDRAYESYGCFRGGWVFRLAYIFLYEYNPGWASRWLNSAWVSFPQGQRQRKDRKYVLRGKVGE